MWITSNTELKEQVQDLWFWPGEVSCFHFQCKKHLWWKYLRVFPFTITIDYPSVWWLYTCTPFAGLPFHMMVVCLHSPCWKMFPFRDAVVGFLHNTSNSSSLEDRWWQSPMLTACQTELSMPTDTNVDRLGFFVPLLLLGWKHIGMASYMPV